MKRRLTPLFLLFKLNLWLLALASFSCLPVSYAAGSMISPTWFPQKSCSESWQDRVGRPYNFDFDKFGTTELSPAGTRYKQFQEAALNRNPIPRSECYKKWTVLVVMDAAQDLMPYSLWDLYEMESAYKQVVNGSTFRKDVLVQHHKFGDDSVRRFHMFQSGRPYNSDLIKTDFEVGGAFGSVLDVQSPVVELKSVHDENFDEKVERFVDFVKWGMQKYPAEHYMVIYWGHGEGWMVNEQSIETHLTGPELRLALKRIYEDSDGLQKTKKIDNFVADACYMQSIELLTEVSGYSRFVSGSAEVQSFLGLPYRTIFSEMNKGFRPLMRPGPHLPDDKIVISGSEERKDEPRLMAKLLPIMMARHLSPQGYGGRIDQVAQASGFSSYGDLRRFTFSSLEMSSLQTELVPALENLAGALIDFLTSGAESLEHQASLIADKIWVSPSFRSQNETREIGSMIELWRGLDPYVDKEIDKVSKALNKTVVLSLKGEKYENPNVFQSVNVWFPKKTRQWEDQVPEFLELSGYEYKGNTVNIFGEENSNWQRLIQLVLNSANE